MGNLIRHQLLRNPNVHFCGYMHPHPLIHRIDMKIQTRDGTTNPGDVLLEAIDDLTTECGKLQENFDGALELFQEEQDKGRNMWTLPFWVLFYKIDVKHTSFSFLNPPA